MQRKLAVIFSGILVALMGPIVKGMSTDMHPLVINFFRIFVGFLTLAIVMPFFDKKTFKLRKRDLKDYLLIGFLISVTFSLYLASISIAPISNVVLIGGFGVVSVALFSFIILKERLKFNQKIAIVVALIGLAIINPFNYNSQHFLGNILALIQTIFYGLLITYIRKEERTHNLGSVMWFFLFASLFLLPTLFIYGVGSNFFGIIPQLLFLGVVTTAVSYVLAAYAAQKLKADSISIISLITIPIFSIIFAVVLINEVLHPKILLGGAILLMSGVVLHYVRKRHIKQIKKQLHIFRI